MLGKLKRVKSRVGMRILTRHDVNIVMKDEVWQGKRSKLEATVDGGKNRDK